MDYFYKTENTDGLRFSWNIWPNTQEMAKKLDVPIACLYTPMNRFDDDDIRVYYEPLMCKGPCKTFLNPYCHVDADAKYWNCPFCGQRNHFPQRYAGITPSNLPREVMPEMTSIEYVLPPRVGRQDERRPGSVFAFVIDICCDQEELRALKNSILEVLKVIPPTSFVGVITFGSIVQVYDLGFPYCFKSHIFRGDEDVDSKKLQQALKTHSKTSTQSRFFLPVSQCEANFRAIIEQIHPDPCPVKNDKRPLRCTGVAVAVSVSLLECFFQEVGGRIMMFMSGPCTVGPGIMVSDSLSEPMRSHHELNNETTKFVRSASKFYQEQAARASKAGHAVDLYSCSFDQTGLLEMQALPKDTGGVVVLSDSFAFDTFQKSFAKVFDSKIVPNQPFSYPTMGLRATLEIVTSHSLKIQGAIGHFTSLKKKSSSVSSSGEIGLGGTCLWKINSLDRNCTYAFYFDIEPPSRPPPHHPTHGMIQFITKYQDSLGNLVVNVTTSAHPWIHPGSPLKSLLQGFDQEAAASLMARLAVFNHENHSKNPTRWLDRHLITLLYHFSDFHKNEPSSLLIPQEMCIYHQFMFYLRRGVLIQFFNNSPDETVFYRFYLHRESVSNILVMIQPTLDSYTLDNEPIPVHLSADSVLPTNVLLLDTYFYIVIHYGSTIAQWRDAQYHLNPEYSNLLELIQLPKADALDLLSNRMPVPIYIECDQNSSQSRFLMASVDPSITHKTSRFGNSQQEQGQVILTEDVNLQIFFDFLKKRVVCHE
ncbi:protein transport protein SEC23-like [Schistocerca gregaria]|uniref:protein transport protein SEC23-like n=1 Tax=Schistocerca gregaria TaxID=7010 RepID=UPI00211ECB45|nr:protein transport protein SEC23-like [Schistocerca gregaria]